MFKEDRNSDPWTADHVNVVIQLITEITDYYNTEINLTQSLTIVFRENDPGQS
jgi:hypothetical protein